MKTSISVYVCACADVSSVKLWEEQERGGGGGEQWWRRTAPPEEYKRSLTGSAAIPSFTWVGHRRAGFPCSSAAPCAQSEGSTDWRGYSWTCGTFSHTRSFLLRKVRQQQLMAACDNDRLGGKYFSHIPAIQYMSNAYHSVPDVWSHSTSPCLCPQAVRKSQQWPATDSSHSQGPFNKTGRKKGPVLSHPSCLSHCSLNYFSTQKLRCLIWNYSPDAQRCKFHSLLIIKSKCFVAHQSEFGHCSQISLSFTRLSKHRRSNLTPDIVVLCTQLLHDPEKLRMSVTSPAVHVSMCIHVHTLQTLNCN